MPWQFRNDIPIYTQLITQLQLQLVSGLLKPGDRLPSVRDLAAELAINPNTIQRAYRELEASGYLYSVPGKGNFAGAHHEVDEGRKAELLRQLAAAAKELRYLGVSEAELTFAHGQNDMVYQNRSTVRLVYKARDSRVRKNVRAIRPIFSWSESTPAMPGRTF